MPKDNIERAIKRATEKMSQIIRKWYTKDMALTASRFLIETATDNPTRTVANIRSYFQQTWRFLGTSGCVEFLFEHNAFSK